MYFERIVDTQCAKLASSCDHKGESGKLRRAYLGLTGPSALAFAGRPLVSSCEMGRQVSFPIEPLAGIVFSQHRDRIGRAGAQRNCASRGRAELRNNCSSGSSNSTNKCGLHLSSQTGMRVAGKCRTMRVAGEQRSINATRSRLPR